MTEKKEVGIAEGLEVKDSPEVIALKNKLAIANGATVKAIMGKKIAEGIIEGLKAAGISNNKPVAPADVQKSTLKICTAGKDAKVSQIITKDTK